MYGIDGAGQVIWETERYPQDNKRVTGSDVINPDHYRWHPSGIDCIDVTEQMNFNLGNALKYIWRAGRKGCIVEDLKKAKWYIERELNRLERDGTAA